MEEEEKLDLSKLKYNPLRDERRDAEAPRKVQGGYNFSVYSPDAKYVSLVGDFNNWIDNRHPMTMNKYGVWSVTIPLKKSTYSYKFNIDGVWVLDNKNRKWAKDRMGDKRSILEVKEDEYTNYRSFYYGIDKAEKPMIDRNGVRFTYEDKFAKSVSVAGTFNNWERNQFYLEKNQHGIWTIVVQIPQGEYEYKYCVDGLWKYDPKNPDRIDDGQGDYKSILVIERDIEDRPGPPFVINYSIVRFSFKDENLPSKYNISVIGTFNQWKSNIHIMTDTDFDHEWFTTLRLNPGNYYYKFYLHGREFFDPTNDTRKQSPGGRESNFLKIRSPGNRRNVKFTYKNDKAKEVYIIGDFNNWDPEADPMLKDQYGLWYIVKQLKARSYSYQYIVDGKWTIDPSNAQTIYDLNGDVNSFYVLR